MEHNHIFPFLWMRGEEEQVLRTEIGKIDECGIKAVCLESRPHEEFCKEGWWHDVDIVLDEAKKRGMKVWILDDQHFPSGYANGMIKEHPERRKLYLACSKAFVRGYPERRLSLDVRRMCKPAVEDIRDIPDAAKNNKERENNRLFSVVAVKVEEGKLLNEETLDLTKSVEGDYAHFTLPEGMWAVFVFYFTRTDGGDETRINLLDKVSAHSMIEAVYEPHFARYADEFGKTIAGFFSDEPQFGNLRESSFEAALGRKSMPLPWSHELEKMLQERYENGFNCYLPFLFQDSAEKIMQDEIRYDYMDCVSRLYQKNFSDCLGNWCEEHGVEYIGHVVEDCGTHSRLGLGAAHYFRAMSGQHMAGFDCIGEQVVFGAPTQERTFFGGLKGDGEFFHYALGKMASSSGHLDPKKKGRTMCELFGAYGWNFGVRDMTYVLNHLLVKGANELVPHAFSMANYPDPDCPPHFYAHGNNPEFPYFAKLMKYANRMCELLSKGVHVASVAVLYDAEADWIGDSMPMQKVCRELLENQIDLDIVSMDMLENLSSYNGSIQENILTINGVRFDALVVPRTRAIPWHFAEWLSQKGDFPVLFIDALPGIIWENKAPEEARDLSAHCQTVPLEKLVKVLRRGKSYDITIEPSFPDLSFYHYRKDGEILVLLNESAWKTFSGTVSLPAKKRMIVYDPFTDCYENIPQQKKRSCTTLAVELAPAETLVLVEDKGQVCTRVHRSFKEQRAGLTKQDISKGWAVSMVRAAKYPAFPTEEWKEALKPISEELPDFSGIIRYRKTVTFEEPPKTAVLICKEVYEVMRVLVNGEEAGFRLHPPYQVDLSGYLKAGENELIIEVATTPAREQLSFPQPPFDFHYETLEATGMAGEVLLYTN